jgi:hypothetical protein
MPRKKITSKPREDAVQYINKKDLNEELKKYYASGDCKENRVISNRLGEMMLQVATKYASKYKFNRYTFKAEMISDAVYRMVECVEKLNPEKNPFSYMTAICHTQFLKAIDKHKKSHAREKEIKERIYQDWMASEGIYTGKIDNTEQKEYNPDEIVIDDTLEEPVEETSEE